MHNLTDKKIESFKAKNSRYSVNDKGCKGLTLVIQPTGTKSFQYIYKDSGRKSVKVTLGKFPDMLIDDARRELMEYKNYLKGFVDSCNEYTPKTVKELIDHYYRNRLDNVTSRKYAESRRRILELYVEPLIGNKRLNTITTALCNNLINNMLKGKYANRARSTHQMMRQMFKWANGSGYIKHDPMASLPPAHFQMPEDSVKDRVLDTKEIKTLFTALDYLIENDSKTEYRILLALKIKLLLGLRTGELLNMKQADVDLKGRTITIVKKKSRSGKYVKGRTLSTYLNDYTLSLVKDMLESSGESEWLCRGYTEQDQPISDKALNRCIKRMFEYKYPTGKKMLGKMAHFSPHDFRRTIATHMQTFVQNILVIDLCLNHSIKSAQRNVSLSGAASHYMKNMYFDERKEALKQWENIVYEEVYGKGKVVQLNNA